MYVIQIIKNKVSIKVKPAPAPTPDFIDVFFSLYIFWIWLWLFFLNSKKCVILTTQEDRKKYALASRPLHLLLSKKNNSTEHEFSNDSAIHHRHTLFFQYASFSVPFQHNFPENFQDKVSYKIPIVFTFIS